MLSLSLLAGRTVRTLKRTATLKTSDSEMQAFNTTMQRAANQIKIEQN